MGKPVFQQPVNLYQYAPNPISWIDPWGWCPTGSKSGKSPKAPRKPRTQLDRDRQAGVAKAWRQERRLVKLTGNGTRRWTRAEKAELLSKGRVKGYEGHHVNSADAHPHLAATPDNIKFVKGRAEHLKEHGGAFQNPTKGPMLDRSTRLDAAKLAAKANRRK